VVQHVGPAELEAAGLCRPGATDAQERLTLLEYLISLGATVDDLVRAKPEELPLLAAMIARWGDRQMHTLDDAAASAGVDRSLILRAGRTDPLLGFVEPVLLCDIDRITGSEA
jgi:hypothetical protein